MRAIAPITGVLERIYDPEPDLDAWMTGVRHAADRTFAGHAGSQVYVMVKDAPDFVGALSAEEPWRTAMLRTMRTADPATVQPYFSGTAVRAIDVDHAELAAAREAGIGSIVVSLGFSDRDRVACLSFVVTEPKWRFARGTRTALDRLSAHLGASYRLRARDAIDEAVLSPEGAVLDAQGVAKERTSRARLREAALGILRAKREGDPVAALAFWTAMVEGRWTLVERLDTDGRRLLIAKRNAPHTIAHAALTERERLVIERASLGASVRGVAYELGMAESTVSEALSRAMKKLGVRDRAELVELYASLMETR